MNIWGLCLGRAISLAFGFSILMVTWATFSGASPTVSSSTLRPAGSLSSKSSISTPSMPGINYSDILLSSGKCSETRFPMRYVRLLNGTIVQWGSRNLCPYLRTSGDRGVGDSRFTFGNPSFSVVQEPAPGRSLTPRLLTPYPLPMRSGPKGTNLSLPPTNEQGMML